MPDKYQVVYCVRHYGLGIINLLGMFVQGILGKIRGQLDIWIVSLQMRTFYVEEIDLGRKVFNLIFYSRFLANNLSGGMDENFNSDFL